MNCLTSAAVNFIRSPLTVTNLRHPGSTAGFLGVVTLGLAAAYSVNKVVLKVLQGSGLATKLHVKEHNTTDQNNETTTQPKPWSNLYAGGNQDLFAQRLAHLITTSIFGLAALVKFFPGLIALMSKGAAGAAGVISGITPAFVALLAMLSLAKLALSFKK